MASTYENDLRLEEMATGENSGSWGTKTNTNLELIADAFSYGTETIADADTTITIADGAADAARSLALKINSSADLTTTRTITLAPNTTSKVWIIENNTSGGQTLTISAGSGSNITLANGKTKIIATDGIGAGSNVIELTQDIAIADLFVDDDLTVGDDIIMDSDGGILKIGADADLQVTHSGSAGTITNATGDLTLDVAGSIYLDSDAGDIFLTDNGTNTIRFNNTGGTLNLKTNTSDADIQFQGNDGGSAINALTLDMSQAGRATFNEGIVLKSSTGGDFGVNINTLSGDSMKLQVVDTGSAGAANGVITVTDGDLILSPSANVGIGTSLPSTKLELASNDATNNGLTNLLTLTHTTTGTAGDGIGTRIVFNAEDDAGTESTMGYIDTLFTDVSDGAEKSAFAFSTRNGGSIAEAMRIDASRNVMINTTTEGVSGAQQFTVASTDSGNTGITVRSGTNSAGALFFSNATSGAGEYAGGFEYNHQNDYLRVITGGSERMRIDSEGRVGIGVVPAAIADSTGVDSLQLGGSFLSHFDEDGSGSIILGNNIYYNGTANKALFDGYTSQYYQAGGTHVWRNSGITSAGSTATMTESMRIDSSGNLLVGKTSSDFGSSVGFEANSNDTFYATRSGGASLTLNRTTSDGDIALFRKDGTTVGSITRASNAFQVIASAVSGTYNMLQLGATAQNQQTYYLQWDAHNGAFYSLNDNAHDLGTSSNRWQDLYLSGGVYLGGTGAANKLEDYEEGTWLPTVEFQNVGSTATTQNSSYTTGSYTKVGDLVTVEFNIGAIVLGNGTGNLQMSLPFTHVGIAAYTGKNTASSGYTVAAETASGYSGVLKAYGVGPLNLMYDSGTSWAFINNGNASTISPNGINGQFTYHTNQ